MPEPKYKQKHKKAYEFQTKLGKEEVKQYEKNMFMEDYQGGQTEADALIERYSQQTTLTEEEKEILRSNVPEAPSFPLLKKEQYDDKNCWGRKKYRSKVKDYYKNRKKYYTTVNKSTLSDGSVVETETKGQLYARTRQQIEERIAKEKLGDQPMNAEPMLKTDTKVKQKDQQKLQTKTEPEDYSTDNDVLQAQKEGFYPEIEEDADAIDEAYLTMKNDQKYIDIEKSIGKKNGTRMMRNASGFGMGLSTYSGPFYSKINKAFREEGRAILGADKVVDGLKKNPLNRDLVCRRGVKGVKTLASMMGLPNYDKMSMEEIKKTFLDQYDMGEEVILSDKSFMSTSLPYAGSNFGAGDDYAIGIEFMILMKKGTAAMNIASLSRKGDEEEVLVAPGTKFKVIKADLDGDSDIIHGNKKSWKIWLVSVND